MAKKKSRSKAEAVRQAVDQAFQSQVPQVPRERIQELVDELASTAGRLRGAVEDLRPASAEDLKELRAEVRALGRRIDALEAKPAPRRSGTAAKKPAAKRSTKASTPASKQGGSARAAASKPTS